MLVSGITGSPNVLLYGGVSLSGPWNYLETFAVPGTSATYSEITYPFATIRAANAAGIPISGYAVAQAT